MGLNFYKDRVCLNVLGGSPENAREVYEAAEGCVAVGVLTADYPDVESYVEAASAYMDALEGNLSVGLGGGNPNQWRAVAEVAKSVKANHFNQVFSAVGWTRANAGSDDAHINALCGPTGTPGIVRISTGPLSSASDAPADVPAATAIDMIREMGGNSVKFFPMKGLACKEELKALAAVCAEKGFCLEPTGGIDLSNFSEIVGIALSAGVPKVIPHVYSSIVDKATGCTKPEDVRTLLDMVKALV